MKHHQSKQQNPERKPQEMPEREQPKKPPEHEIPGKGPEKKPDEPAHTPEQPSPR